MISDKIENLKKYQGIDSRFAIIADFLASHDLAKTENGRIDIENGLYVNISEYTPYAAPDKWEAHRDYADLQIVLSGDERLDGAPITDAVDGNGYNAEGDYELFGKCTGAYASVYAVPGTFAYFAPDDAHRPGLHWNADKVKKAVFKLAESGRR